MRLGRVVRPLTDRLGGTRFARVTANKIFPRHWSFLLGEVALYSFLVLVATGIYLTFFFDPSETKQVYNGSYGPLVGTTVSGAYASTMRLSFETRAGLLIRQTHHWAALLFIGAIMLHMARVYFTGAFRRPRELNWIIGMTLLLLATAMGFTGYSLPGDLLSGTGLRIAYSVAESIPFAGPWLAFLIVGGEWPGNGLTSRLYGLHIIVLPLIIFGLLAAHLMILWRQKHTHMTGPGAREHNIIGERLWPAYAMKAGGLALLVSGGLLLLGGLVQINPVWLYGPYEPASVSSAAQPDWYIGFLEGSLRLWPGWQFDLFGVRVPALFWSGVAMPGAMFGLLYAVPFLHRRFTGDDEVHHLAQRPRQAPGRTAAGAAAIAFYVVLVVAGGQDVLAAHFSVSVDRLRTILRVLVFVAPLVSAITAYRVCRNLAEGSSHPERNPVGDLLMRTEAGGYVAIHHPDASPPGSSGDQLPEDAQPIDDRGAATTDVETGQR
jgi:ubiquinol-cytochrome c reductase cytochrome b subunit